MAQVEKLRKASDSGSCFDDEDFDIEANKELTKALKTFRLKDRSGSASFIDEGSDACDVKQGQLGDCWFLAALSSIAAKDQSGTKVAKIKEDSVKRVLQTGFNTTMLAKGAGGYHFKFFRMGEWVDVVIDDKLPDRHEGKINRAIESKNGEWWVPLVEKAYAKFHGGYNNINGGESPVAMTELSGGIAVDTNKLDSSTEVKIGDLLKKLQRNSLITTSNRDGAGNELVTKGLVSGHAYSLLLVETMTLKDGSKLDMVKIRNPHGKNEWDGAWSDSDTENWARVSDEEKKRMGVVNSNDGTFWMELGDWIDEFEYLAICALPGLDVNDEDGDISEEEAKSRDVRLRGAFPPGVQNYALSQPNNKNPELSCQIELTVGEYGQTDSRLIWLQLLIDSPIKVKRNVIVNFWARKSTSGDDPFAHPLNGPKEFRQKFQKVEPVFPNSGNPAPKYTHNGFLLDVLPGKYLITVSTKLEEPTNAPTDFMVRAMGSNLQVRPVTTTFFE